MSWPLVKISDFCQTGSGGTPSRDIPEYYEGDIPWIKSGDLRENIVTSATEFISQEAINKSSAKIVSQGAILVAMYGATVGRMALLGIDAATNQAVCNVVPDASKADTKYVYYALLSKVPDFLRSAIGGAQPNISQGLIRSTEIPLPPLPEQKRIAAILDKADAIRRKRQQAIQLADDFLRAVFLDMFGDPVTNPKGFPVGTIRDLVDTANYGSSAKASETEGEFPMLRMGNITYSGAIDFSGLKYVDLSKKDQPKYLVEKGDLLFNRTNSKELVGKTAVYDRDDVAAIAGYLIRVRMNEKGNSYYVSGYLNSTHGKSTLQSMCKSIVGMANINAQEMQNIQILLPPIEIQNKYAAIFQTTKQRLRSQSQSEGNLADLFSALSQKAFRGEC
ncbi:restriction endonuclease subunit S [Pseudomonas sp. phDV1]|uniref:restriction endonuclease subunit S n=1 Tax=Ectopseudomonas oleovorans TaxID=301 RepID=UPI000E303106|nr:restriction endonuclease subunit S [Pseudomonas sp. phDV1]AXO60017.1 restriction endonuclease subunit S [Pseudomonas sp. phDV1]MCR1828730.1 restriction endonuclease subunit S [Pseudomonas oleovorans]